MGTPHMESSEAGRPIDPAEEEDAQLQAARSGRSSFSSSSSATSWAAASTRSSARWEARPAGRSGSRSRVALVMAAFTAGSYAELVSKYPRAGGAGLYVHKAFGNPFFSFMVAFAVAMSGITSAATLSRGFGGDYLSEFIDVDVVLAALRSDHADRPRQLPGHRRVGEAQRRLHGRRDRRPPSHRPDRGDRGSPGRRGHRRARSRSRRARA